MRKIDGVSEETRKPNDTAITVNFETWGGVRLLRVDAWCDGRNVEHVYLRAHTAAERAAIAHVFEDGQVPAAVTGGWDAAREQAVRAWVDCPDVKVEPSYAREDMRLALAEIERLRAEREAMGKKLDDWQAACDRMRLAARDEHAKLEALREKARRLTDAWDYEGAAVDLGDSADAMIALRAEAAKP